MRCGCLIRQLPYLEAARNGAVHIRHAFANLCASSISLGALRRTHTDGYAHTIPWRVSAVTDTWTQDIRTTEHCILADTRSRGIRPRSTTLGSAQRQSQGPVHGDHRHRGCEPPGCCAETRGGAPPVCSADPVAVGDELKGVSPRASKLAGRA